MHVENVGIQIHNLIVCVTILCVSFAYFHLERREELRNILCGTHSRRRKSVSVCLFVFYFFVRSLKKCILLPCGDLCLNLNPPTQYQIKWFGARLRLCIANSCTGTNETVHMNRSFRCSLNRCFIKQPAMALRDGCVQHTVKEYTRYIMKIRAD